MCSVEFQRAEYAAAGGTLRGWVSAQCKEGFPGVAGQGWNGPFCEGTLSRKTWTS